MGLSCAQCSAALGPVDAQPQAVLVAGRDLARPQRAARAVGVAQQDLRVVVELAARRRTSEIGEQFGDLEPGDIVGEVEGVRADVAERAAGARALRDRRAIPPASCRSSRSGRSASPGDIRPERAGSRRARRPAPSRACAAPADSRCSCGSARRCGRSASTAAFIFLASASDHGQRLVADDVNARLRGRRRSGRRARGSA